MAFTKIMIGAMNSPERELYEDIRFIRKEFDFLDLTLEPGTSYAGDIDVGKLRKAVKGFHVVGHTPWNLPIASHYQGARDTAIEEFLKCLDVFSKIGVKLVNAHPSMGDVADPEKVMDFNVAFFKEAVKHAKKLGLEVMMENVKGLFNEIEVIDAMLELVPGLKLHWDVGHANLGNQGEKKTMEAFERFRKKIVHVHFSDNNGIEDQHLPIGAGNIDWPAIMEMMEDYKGGITLEVHSQDLSYLLFSRDKVRYLEGK